MELTKHGFIQNIFGRYYTKKKKEWLFSFRAFLSFIDNRYLWLKNRTDINRISVVL